MEETGSSSAREEISELITRLFVGTDEGRWDDVAKCLAAKVLLDMSSINGVKASRTSPKRIVEQWETGFKGLAATHHQIGNVLVNVEGEGSGAFCYVTATHFFPNPTGSNVHTIVGSYDFHLALDSGKWVIDTLRFNLKYEDGNLLLSDLARKASRKS